MKKYRVFVQKTVQEQNFEPFVIGLECQFSTKEEDQEQINNEIDREYDELEDKLDKLIKDRLS